MAAPTSLAAPLTGATVAVTRATEQAGPLVERLQSLGAEVVEIAAIRIAEPADGGALLRAAVDDLRAYDWVVLTSPNAARRFLDAVGDHTARLPPIAVVGPGTGRVVTDQGIAVALVPQRAIGEGLVEAFPAGRGRVLLPRAAVARDVVPAGLREKGWLVDVVEAYRTVPVVPGPDALALLDGADLVCFTSSSTVDALVAAAGRDRLPDVVVSMGEATTATATAAGVRVDVTASPSTIDGLLDAVVQAWTRRNSGPAGAPGSLPFSPVSTTITTAEDFQRHIDAVQAKPGYAKPFAYGVGTATVSPSGKVLDTAYPVVNREENLGSAAVLADVVGHMAGTATYVLDAAALDRALAAFAWTKGDGKVHLNVEALAIARSALDAPAPVGGSRRVVVAFVGAADDKPVDAHDVYFRLHLLSNRKTRPHEVSLDGAFGLLNNVVWTSHGPIDPDGFELVRARLAASGAFVHVHGVDKFPRMVDYVVPAGVRIADASRVRLGAHLADGTTVMHEGFCNFNAGTLGTSMVEGRISAGVIVGNGSDVGGGASIMGTLSGGGKEVVRIGEGCLLGANAGVGISLGDNCIVEAGLYITAGTRVKLPDGSVVKARELSGESNLLYRRNSQTGAVEAVANGVEWGGLNAALHKN